MSAILDGINLAFFLGLLGFGISLLKDMSNIKTETATNNTEIEAIKEDINGIKEVLQKRFNILIVIFLVVAQVLCNVAIKSIDQPTSKKDARNMERITDIR